MSIQPAGEGWPRYARLARELDEVRAVEQAITAGLQAGSAEMTAHADALAERLAGQQARLAELARDLRLRPGKLTPLRPVRGQGTAGLAQPHPQTGLELLDEPARMLRELAEQIDLADGEAARADERGHRAAILPRWPAELRNGLIYGVAAVLTLLSQGLLWVGVQGGQHDRSPGFVSLFLLIPAAWYLIGYLVVRMAGTPRVAAPGNGSSARLGLVLCFLAGPAVLMVVILRSALAR